MIIFTLILHPVLRTVTLLNTSAKVRQTDEEIEGIKTFYPQSKLACLYINKVKGKKVTNKKENGKAIQ